MTESKTHRWSALNNLTVIEAMRKDRNSEHWDTCNAYIRYCIEINFPNLLPHLKEETVQNIMVLVFTRLSTFRAESSFTTWLSTIARNKAIDVLRQQKDIIQLEKHTEDLPDGRESDIEKSITNKPKSPEEIVLAQEQKKEVFAAIEAFLQKHSKSERNRAILQMVMFDGYRYEEAAQILNINAPVVGYVVRSARSYIWEMLSLHSEEKKSSV